MSFEDRKILKFEFEVLKCGEYKMLTSILDMLGPEVEIEDIAFKLQKESCYCYNYSECNCKSSVFIHVERLETDAEYEKRVKAYLEKLARKNDPERKKKLAEKRQQTLKQKQEEQKKKDLAELERLKRLYDKQ